MRTQLKNLDLIKKLIISILDLVYPNLCIACKNNLSASQNSFCIHCLYSLPFANDTNNADDTFGMKFWGRLNIHGSHALFQFIKGSPVQDMLFGLKYKGRHDLAVKLGQELGKRMALRLEESEEIFLIPVPLHADKLRKRKYNQSEKIAIGINMEIRNSKICFALNRKKNTSTQTKKSRYERIENVSDAFKLNSKFDLSGKHVVVIDDVVTSGATLESCVQTLITQNKVRISLCALAVAGESF